MRGITRDTLEITAADGAHAFTAATTAKVDRRGDPVWTGALIGFLPGFVMGAQFVAGFSDHEEPLTTYVTAGGIVGLAGAGTAPPSTACTRDWSRCTSPAGRPRCA